MTTDTSTNGKIGLLDAILGRDQATYGRIIAFIFVTMGISLVLLHMYTAAFGQVHYVIQRHFTISVAMAMAVLWRPLGRRSWRDKINWWFVIDLVIIAMAVVPFIYVLTDLKRWVSSGVSTITPFETVLGTMFTIAILETTRRMISWILSVIALIFVLQNMYAPYLPGPFFGPSISWPNQVLNIWSETGAFGLAADMVSSYLVMFMFFAALIQASGAGTVLMNIALAATGKYAGGPAKVAVVASSLFGTMSGSSVANVVGTGTFTIPMMKRMGFKPTQAAAIEAAASSGGQFVPPVLGATAFLITQFLGVSYFRVIAAIIIPAFLYYLSVFLQVHFMAKKGGLEGIPASQLPRLSSALKPAWVIFIPMAVMMYLLFMGYGLGQIALLSTFILAFCGLISKTEPRLTPRSIFDAFSNSIGMILPLAVVIASLGIILASFYASGVSDKMSTLVVSLSGGSLWAPIILTAAICLILGMAVSTPIIYIMMLFLTIPALVKIGVEPLSAHLFTFFLGVASGITPPVCTTAFTAGALAGAPLMRTGLYSMRLAAVAFMIPFLFVFNPELLMIGSPGLIITRLIFATGGVVAMSIGFEQYLTNKLSWIYATLFVLDSIFLWNPISIPINIVGLVGLVMLTFTNLFLKQRKAVLADLAKMPVAKSD